MNNQIQTLMRELKTALKTIYGEHLKGVYLYGSYARGEEDSESDVDVLVVLDDFDHYGSEIDRTGPLVSELSLKYRLSISRVFVSQRDWLRAETPFLVNAREEVIPL